MRKQSVITERDAESGRDQQDRGNDKVKPIKAEIPQISRYGGERENKRPDQERARRPINPIDRDSKGQGITSSQGTTKHHVGLRPGMDFAAMRAGEFLTFHLRCGPKLFLHGSTGIGQTRR